MPKLYNQEGQPLDENDLEFGDIVFDDQGNAYEFVEDDDAGEEYEVHEEELSQSWPESARGIGTVRLLREPPPAAGSFTAVGDGGALQGVLRRGPGRR